MRISAAHIYEACVVPTLRRVFQQIYGADRESFALHDGRGTARCQHRAGHKRKCLEGTPRTKRTRPRKGVVDQMRPLQMKPALTDVADFQRSVLTEALLHGAVPLLNVLRGSMGIEGCEAHCRRR